MTQYGLHIAFYILRFTFYALRFTFHVSRISVLLLLAVYVQSASSHPLGNFGVSRYSRLELSEDRIHLHYVLDMAEIPAVQERNIIDTDGDGAVSHKEHANYAKAKVEALHLTINHSPVKLKLLSHELTFPPGQGGLLTLRLYCLMEASLPPISPEEVWQVDYRDDNYSNRLGWKEIVARPSPGVTLLESTVPQQDQSDELRRYPEDMLSSPVEVQEAHLTFAPGAGSSIAGHNTMRAPGVLERAEDRFAALISSESLSLPIILFSLLVALGLGAFHALSPGHGKAVVGAYLVGAKGTAKHAIFLGLTVTITHTAGVFALGIVTLFASRYVLPEQLYPWLGAASGLIVVGIGGMLLVHRLRRGLLDSFYHSHRQENAKGLGLSVGDPDAVMSGTDKQHRNRRERGKGKVRTFVEKRLGSSHKELPCSSENRTFMHAESQHSHDSDDHHHPHHHHKAEGAQQGHSHLPPGADGSSVTWRSLLALGVTGGLLPCPSALVVLLSAIALHRVGFGLLLIVAFSVGLAGVLTGVGLLFVYARRFLERFRVNSQTVQFLPVLSAFVITLVGLGITAQAFSHMGWLNF